MAAQQHLFYQSDQTVGCSPGLWATDAGEQNLQPVGESSMFVSNNNITGKTERLGHHTGKG